MFESVRVFLTMLILNGCAISDWVEIPQFANRKNYMSMTVTPHDPYIYTPSFVFTSSPTTDYEESLAPPLIYHPYPSSAPSKKNQHRNDPKKSITKMPDFVFRKPFATTSSTHTPPFPKPTAHSFFRDRNATRKTNHNKPKKQKPASPPSTSSSAPATHDATAPSRGGAPLGTAHYLHPQSTLPTKRKKPSTTSKPSTSSAKPTTASTSTHQSPWQRKKDPTQGQFLNTRYQEINFDDIGDADDANVGDVNGDHFADVNGDHFDDDDEYEWVYDDDDNGDVLPGDDTETAPGFGDSQEQNSEEYYYNDDEEDDNPNASPESSDQEEYYEEEYEDDVEEDKDGRKEGGAEKETKGGYFGFIPFLKKIQDTLLFRNGGNEDQSSSKGDSYEGKVSFLENMKNSLLHTIRSRISKLWPSRSKRAIRSAKEDGWVSEKKGHDSVGFPSNEAALLTLAFLTFAVFLIKCILKLIHALKAKHAHKVIKIPIYMNGSIPSTVATFRSMNGDAAGRQFLDHKEVAQIMSQIDNFKYNNH